MKSCFKALVGGSLKIALVDNVGILEGCHQLSKLVLPPLLVLLLAGLFEQALRQPCEALVLKIANFHINLAIC